METLIIGLVNMETSMLLFAHPRTLITTGELDRRVEFPNIRCLTEEDTRLRVSEGFSRVCMPILQLFFVVARTSCALTYQ